ncbi:hypothetical protein ABH926_005145 [Catenulispora sp. GP43]|uniref:hypothetical protein n=1 Tax=Catenulispora sp. GP43 TaxID=3156263 RepID=UPI003518029F
MASFEQMYLGDRAEFDIEHWRADMCAAHPSAPAQPESRYRLDVTIDISAVTFDGSAMAAAVAVSNVTAARAEHATTVLAAPRLARLLRMIGADDLAGLSITVVSGERTEPGGDTADASGRWHADP